MPLEECGNMIITTLAYAQRAQDTAYLTQHYAILKQWTGYLVDEALIPANQLSTDDFQGQLANQTNLALKGIIAIQAMSEIASKTGNGADATNYSNIAHDYIGQWQEMAVVTDANPPHTNLDYQNDTSHGEFLVFMRTWSKLNWFRAALQSLCRPSPRPQPGPSVNLRHAKRFLPHCSRNIRRSPRHQGCLYKMYLGPSPSQKLKTNHLPADWQMWTASIASKSTQTLFISLLAKWINETPTNRAFTDLYNTQTGE
jgi:hypothetical protein